MKKRVFNADTQRRRWRPLPVRVIREIRSCSLRLCVSALFLSVAVARAESPGTHYPSGGTRPGVSPQAGAGSNAPYARTITVYGNVHTNDLLRFLDRTGSRVAGTNVLGALDYYGTNWQATAAAEAAARAAGDAVARTNLQAAITAEAVARAAGDVVARTNLQAALTAEAVARAAGDTAGSNRVTTALASFAATGSVANAGTAATAGYATSAARLAGSDSWQTVEHGTATLWRVSDDTTRVYIVSASADFNGLAVGSVLTWVGESDAWIYGTYLVYDSGGTHVYILKEDNEAIIWGTIGSGTLPLEFVHNHPLALGSCVIDYVPVTNTYPLAINDDLAAHNTDGSAHADIREAALAAPEWIGVTNLSASVTVTNVNERPIYLYATGTVSVAFSGLRTPMPLYLVLRGPDSLTFPGAYYIGGGTWQTNMSNHFVVWTYGTNLFVNPVTASED